MSRPTRIRLRPWQSDALGKLDAADGPDFLAVATPGAGKTTFALAAIVQHLGDHPGRRVVVVAPTQHLKSQWAKAAAVFGLHLDHLWTPADSALPDDMHGIVTTYQQVAQSSAQLAAVSRDSFVVLDEVHHAGDERSWGVALLEAFDGAAQRLSLSGTPFRSDDAEIPFVDYHLDEARPDVEYGYGDALADRGVVRPVYFPRTGGFMEWVASDGEVVAATFEDELSREKSNQRLRTALSLEGDWLPTVLGEADAKLTDIRRDHTDAGGLVIATDVDHARAIADLLGRHNPGQVTLATSDDPSASKHIARFAESDERWIVAVRMVSEGVDIPRLRLAVFATTTTTELFFRQAVGRVVRWVRGAGRQKAYVFLPDDPRLTRHATSIAESRRHSLRRRAEREVVRAEGSEPMDEGDEEQLSMFSVIGSVAMDSETTGGEGVFGRDPDDPNDDAAQDPAVDREPAGVELLFHPPPLPSGRAAKSAGAADDPASGHTTLRERKAAMRKANADLAVELVHATGWGHAQVNRELNRLAGIDQIGAATVAQLESRHAAGRRWLRNG
ncbi:MAG: DEAD/DEAH box helicase [Actinomycetia bacterium]|nr:DEAD/DEAH box helicase [Actinomycetes bacterium]